MNTRIMTLKDYDPELDAEAERLRRTVPEMRAELTHDPEGCFGGRGNNIGYAMVERVENRLAELTNLGYTIRTHPFIDLLQAGVDLSTVEKIVARDDKLFIGGTPGNRRTKEIRGKLTGVNWVYVHDQGWKGQEPPQAILDAAEAVTQFHGWTLMEWRGEFHCPRVCIG